MKTKYVFVFLLLTLGQNSLAVDSEVPMPVFLEQSISRERTYPQQPVELSVHLYVEDAAKNVPGLDPFTRASSYQAGRVPILFLTWSEDQEFPEGIRPTEPQEMWADSIRKGTLGFTILSPTRKTIPLQSTLYYPQPEKVKRPNKAGKETLYWKYTIKRHIVPILPGKITFSPAKFAGIMLGTFDDAENTAVPQAVPVAVSSKPVSLTVLEVPKEDRPKNDVGLFGVFRWNVELTPTTAKVGEPLTLTVSFHGVGSIVNAEPPDISTIPQITDHFKTYPATEERYDDFYRFTYTIRPKNDGTLVFPELTVSYFNVEQERFTELKSNPITLSIESVERMETSTLPQGGEALRPKHQEPLLTESGIFANMVEPQGGENQRISAKKYFVFCAGLGLFYAIIASAVLFCRIKRPANLKKPRQIAIERARQAFMDLPDLLAANKPYEACVQTQTVLVRFITEVSQNALHDSPQRSSRGITPSEAVDIVRKWKLHTTQIEELGDLFDLFDAIRFGSLPPNKAAKSVERGAAILEDIIVALPSLEEQDSDGQTKNVLNTSLPPLLVVLIPFLFSGCGVAPSSGGDSTGDFLEAVRAFEEVDSRFSTSPSQIDTKVSEKEKRAMQNDFRRVAAMYQGLIDRGIESGPIFYNQGNAWCRVGETAQAISSYRRAQRYMPGNPYLLANLKTVAFSDNPAERSKFLSGLFFWQHSTSYPLKLRLTLMASVLAFAIAFIALFRHDTIFAKLAVFFAVIAILAIGSAGYDWYRFDRMEYGVVSAEQTIPRKGNSPQYEPAFTEPVAQRVEFIVRDKRGQWIEAEFAGGETGWIPLSDAVIY